MVKKTLGWVALLAVVALPVWAHSEHEHGGTAMGEKEHGGASVVAPAQPSNPAASQEQTLTGEVVDVFCYLSHGEKGLGKDHAGCAKQCIKSGLPVAIKVGDQLYLASMADHTAANEKLADLAAEQVTVRGTVMEKDGQRLIAITQVE